MLPHVTHWEEAYGNGKAFPSYCQAKKQNHEMMYYITHFSFKCNQEKVLVGNL